MLYFIKQKGTNLVKIGYTDGYNTVDARLQTLQVGNPEELELIGTLCGDTGTEAILHAILKQHRVRGEWFNLPTDIVLIFDVCMYIEPEQDETVIDFTKNTKLMAVHNKVMRQTHR